MMTRDQLLRTPSRALVVVRWGSRGEQLAQYIGMTRASGLAIVRKWRKNGRVWTQSGSPVAPRQVLRIATEHDIRHFKPNLETL